MNYRYIFFLSSWCKWKPCSLMKPWQYCFVERHFHLGNKCLCWNYLAWFLWHDYCVCFSGHHGRGLYDLLCLGSAGDAHQLCCLLSQGVSILVGLPFPPWCKDKSGLLHSFLPKPLQISYYTYYQSILIGSLHASTSQRYLGCIVWTMIYI